MLLDDDPFGVGAAAKRRTAAVSGAQSGLSAVPTTSLSPGTTAGPAPAAAQNSATLGLATKAPIGTAVGRNSTTLGAPLGAVSAPPLAAPAPAAPTSTQDVGGTLWGELAKNGLSSSTHSGAPTPASLSSFFTQRGVNPSDGLINQWMDYAAQPWAAKDWDYYWGRVGQAQEVTGLPDTRDLSGAGSLDLNSLLSLFGSMNQQAPAQQQDMSWLAPILSQLSTANQTPAAAPAAATDDLSWLAPLLANASTSQTPTVTGGVESPLATNTGGDIGRAVQLMAMQLPQLQQARGVQDPLTLAIQRLMGGMS